MTRERHTFTDEQWQRIAPLMPPYKGRPGGARRIFFDALLWMARTGAAWRDLPKRLGKWIHAVCDALGNLLRFLLAAGQRHDSKPAPGLLDGLQAKALLADKAYDLDKIVQSAQAQGMQVIIPSRVNRKKAACPGQAPLQGAAPN